MKRLIYTMLAITFLLSSCSSDDDYTTIPEPEKETQVVSIKVSGVEEFTEVRSGLKSATLKDAGIKHIHYFVYNKADGSFVKQKNFFDKGNLVINDTLSVGKYNIFVFASNYTGKEYETGYEFYYTSSSVVKHTYSQNSLLYFNPSSNLDFFYSDSELSLEAGVTPESKVMTLDRITSKVEIIPLDANKAPAEVVSVFFSVNKLDAQIFQFKTGKVTFSSSPSTGGRWFSKALSRAELLKINDKNPITATFLAGGAQKDFPIIVGFDKTGSGGYSNHITIKSAYTLERNKVLRLSGNIFTHTPQIGGINVDNEWGEVVGGSFD